MITDLVIAGEGGVICCLLAHGYRHTRSPKHQHAWELLAAESTEEKHRGVESEFSSADGRITRLLYRCSCGDVKTEKRAGHWTVDQLVGPTAQERFVMGEGR